MKTYAVLIRRVVTWAAAATVQAENEADARSIFEEENSQGNKLSMNVVGSFTTAEVLREVVPAISSRAPSVPETRPTITMKRLAPDEYENEFGDIVKKEG